MQNFEFSQAGHICQGVLSRTVRLHDDEAGRASVVIDPRASEHDPSTAKTG